MKISDAVGFGSHLPALKWAVERTHGAIFEMGAGLYSTPYLISTGRLIVTYELDQGWVKHIEEEFGIRAYRSHEWTTEAPNQHFAVALLDGGTDATWLVNRRKMFDVIDADIILVHDIAPHLFSEDYRPWHGADKRFKYNAWYTPVSEPATWITSDEPIEGLPEC